MIKWYGHVLFAVVVLVALSMTWYSMMDLATNTLSLPFILSLGVSLAFDGGAVFLGLLSIEYAKTADSGVLAELGTFAFIATSTFIVVQHARLSDWGIVGMVMFGAAPIIVGVMLKAYLSFITRQARKDAGRIVERLPVAGKLTWLRYPKESFKLISVAMQHRLIGAATKMDMPTDKYNIFGQEQPVTATTDKVSRTAVDKTENTPKTITETLDKKPEQLSQPETRPALTSGDKLSLPVWLPHEPTMSLGKLSRTCLDNGVSDLETVYRYAISLKGQDVNKMSLSRTLSREKQKTT